MHKVCASCGKLKLHHGRGYCQQCYRIHMRNMKTPQTTAKFPALKAANLPTVFISTPQTPSIITNDEESMEAIENESVPEIEGENDAPTTNQRSFLTEFSRPVNLLANRLRLKCLSCYRLVEPEVACQYSLIYCGNCYFVKTKRPRPVLQRTHIAENQQQQAKVSSSVDEKSASTPKLQPTNEPNSIAIEDTDDDDIIELPVPQQAQNQQIQQAPAIQTIENNASVVLSSGSEDGQY